MVEFTGERVIPGQVNTDLWNEHLARYAFARTYARGKRVLDVGCGTGYGCAELAGSAARVTGLDSAQDSIAYCQEHYQLPSVRFVVSSGAAMPFNANSFDLIVAFEVIEHVPDYRAFLDECARVLSHQGLFIVSSPNKRYYAESRSQTGPNPYHEHEFEDQEFESELSRVFSNVKLLLQNRVECFAFHPSRAFCEADARIHGGGGDARDAHFLIGMCSFGPLPDLRSFVYVPKAANLLREREQHIQLLEGELSKAKQWLKETQTERDSLLELYRKQKEELEQRNRWASQLNSELESAGERVIELQEEAEAFKQESKAVAAGYEAKVADLEAENRSKTEWALATETRLTKEVQAKCAELAESVRLLEAAESTVVERTLWAQRAENQRTELAALLEMVRASRWIRLGRRVGLGPRLQ